MTLTFRLRITVFSIWSVRWLTNTDLTSQIPKYSAISFDICSYGTGFTTINLVPGILMLFRARPIATFFFLNDTPPPEIYPLPLHAALPISKRSGRGSALPGLPGPPPPRQSRGRRRVTGLGPAAWRASDRPAPPPPPPSGAAADRTARSASRARTIRSDPRRADGG